MVSKKIISVLSIALLLLPILSSCASSPKVSFEDLTCDGLTEQWTGHKYKDNFKRNNQLVEIIPVQKIERISEGSRGIGCDSIVTLKHSQTRSGTDAKQEEIILQAWEQADGSIRHEFAFCYLVTCEQLFAER
jgi:hypothetical protein